MGAHCCRIEPMIDPSSKKIICLKEMNKRYFIQIFNCNSETSNEVEINPNLFTLKYLSQISLDNILYLIGEELHKTSELECPVSSFIVINSVSSPITIKFELPPKTSHKNPSLCFNNKEELYVIGGYGTKSCEMFNIKNKVWTELPDLPNERYGCNIVALNSRSIILYGGIDSSNPNNLTNTVLLYNRETNTGWEPLLISPDDRDNYYLNKHFCGVTMYKNSIWIIGGINNLTNKKTDEILTINCDNPEKIEQSGISLVSKAQFPTIFSSCFNNNLLYLYDEEDFKIHKIDINHSNSEKIDFYRSKDIEE